MQWVLSMVKEMLERTIECEVVINGEKRQWCVGLNTSTWIILFQNSECETILLDARKLESTKNGTMLRKISAKWKTVFVQDQDFAKLL